MCYDYDRNSKATLSMNGEGICTIYLLNDTITLVKVFNNVTHVVLVIQKYIM